MAATPFKGILTLKGLQTGADYALPFSASDVAAAFVTYDGTGATAYTPPEKVQLVDIVLTAAGVDTSRLDLFVNGTQAPISFNDASVKNTIPVPRIVVHPVFAQLAQIQLKQA